MQKVNGKEKLIIQVFIGVVVTGIGLLLIFLVIIPVVNNSIQNQKTINEIKQAGYSLQELRDDIIDGISNESIETQPLEEVCYQSSAKLGKGDVRCGSKTSIIIKDEGLYAGISERILNSIKSSGKFTYKSTDDTTGKDTEPGLWIHFSHQTVSCHAIGTVKYEAMSVSIACLDNVADFIPGYSQE